MNTIQSVIFNCPHQVRACHQAKALLIDQELAKGTPFTSLGGKQVRCRKGLLRFKLGTDWRLLYESTAAGYRACFLVSRQSFERELKRRRATRARKIQSKEKYQ